MKNSQNEDGFQIIGDNDPEAENLFELGVNSQLANNKDNLKNAVQYFKQAAEKNHLNAHWALGQCYEYAKGVSRSIKQAMHYYKTAADQGHALSQLSLGLMLLNNKIHEDIGAKYLELAINDKSSKDALSFLFWTPENMSEWMLKLATYYEESIGTIESLEKASYYFHLSAKTSIDAQLRLGHAYLEGELRLKKDESKAFYFFNQAAKHKNNQALYFLGKCYEEGLGVEKSLNNAFNCYNVAINNPFDAWTETSFGKLGLCYENGIGTERSLENAIYYYILAGEHGFTEGYNQAGNCFLELEAETGSKENLKQAHVCFKRAALNNSNWGYLRLAYTFYRGIGVTQSLQKAFDNYLKAGKSGLPEGYYYAGLCIEKIQQKNWRNEAFKYFKLAADEGYPQAQFYVAQFFEKGLYGEKSQAKAIHYYELAATNDNDNDSKKKALFELGRIYEHGIGVSKSYAKAMDYYNKSENIAI